MAPKLNFKMERDLRMVGSIGTASCNPVDQRKPVRPNDMSRYQSRFDKLNLGSGQVSSQSSKLSLQEHAARTMQRTQKVSKDLGLSESRVPCPRDAGKTMDKMYDRFVNQRLERYQIPEKKTDAEKAEKMKALGLQKMARKEKKKEKKKEKEKEKVSKTQTSNSKEGLGKLQQGAQEKPVQEGSTHKKQKKGRQDHNM
eukprot:gnl/MRDRNA2_/MRDRNA2_28658_c0_seq2.p1 gnl/MRDRNA2_/MRDRNA2_28658_c0~~gnl/MRDRNA2_/MRDRNA2_28658_c0_seq2.p1  ORF type:complete len:198 (-),score=52.36 gnl/MRDRNA2_/MRDRNA2_28658_c0_seq2:26-619(-)